jgi:iron complex transport system ATP-binding protein
VVHVVAGGEGPVEGVDVELLPGLVVVTGEEGCGTSTALRVLAAASGAALLTAPPGTEWQDADVAADALGAPHLVGREMWTLSGGERQRVRLATLLASDAPALLADEPLGYLDDRGVAQALAALREAASARPVLVVCKSDPRAAEAADLVVEMAAGRLVVNRSDAGPP